MLKEAEDVLAVLRAVHGSVDTMLADVEDADWTRRPAPGFNAIAPVVEHMALVERRFLSAVAGRPEAIDTQAPFKAEHWDVAAVKREWQAALEFSAAAVAGLREGDLDAPGLKLGIGELNRRQLLAYAIGHATHHRGQLPLLKRLLQSRT